MTNKIAIIQFPGSNCEYETKTAIEATGIKADIVRWNTNQKDLDQYSGFILPGGFSYQDRVRAGAISAKLPIINALIRANQNKKPILGICNGCQILAEIGLVPDIDQDQTLQMALTHNKKNDERVGFICDWVYLKVENSEKSLFTENFNKHDILPIQINHGEGRFVFAEEIKDTIENVTQFSYCKSNGDNAESFPENPNGSQFNCAGLTNKTGNVLAIMPHPERACFLKQIPTYIDSQWAIKKHGSNAEDIHEAGPWQKLFENMTNYITKQLNTVQLKEHQH